MTSTILQEAPKDVQTLLYVACVGLIAAVVYMYLNHKKEFKDLSQQHAKALKEKDDSILKIIDEHKNDLKENNRDYKYLVDKFSEMVDQIKEKIHAK